MKSRAVGILYSSTERDSAIAETIEARCAEAGIPVAYVRADRPADKPASVGIAIGREAFRSFAVDRPPIPILPIGVGVYPSNETLPDLAGTLRQLDGDTDETLPTPILEATLDGDRIGSAVFDVCLMSAEPARIAEYAVDSKTIRLGTVRADGLVVATAPGSTGYAGRVTGPRIQPSAGDVVEVIPVAPFHTHRDTWILDPRRVGIDIVRAQGAIDIRLDGEPAAEAATGGTLRCAIADRVRVLPPIHRADEEE